MSSVPVYRCPSCGREQAYPVELVAGGCMSVGHARICKCGALYLDPDRHVGSPQKVAIGIRRRTEEAYGRE